MNDIFLHIKIAIQSHALPMHYQCNENAFE